MLPDPVQTYVRTLKGKGVTEIRYEPIDQEKKEETETPTKRSKFWKGFKKHSKKDKKRKSQKIVKAL
jgi:hypothetical protein